MTTEHTFTIGPRQTVDRACHPTLGEGRAVYGNGPAFFLPDVGEPVAARSIEWAGASSKPVPRSWHVMVMDTGDRIELDTTDRERGERHYRRWHPTHGPGWYVGGAIVGHDRWESDSGIALPIVWDAMRVGRPVKGKTKAERAEDEQWWTVTLRNGEVFTYRACPPGEEPKREERPAPPRKVVDFTPAAPTATPAPSWAGAKFPPPNATRAEVTAWLNAHGSRA